MSALIPELWRRQGSSWNNWTKVSRPINSSHRPHTYTHTHTHMHTPPHRCQLAPEAPGIRALFTHVPLYRPNGSYCGQDRRDNKKCIEQGVGYQYRNLVHPNDTTLILKQVRPDVIFSGDDHDVCLIHHVRPDNDTAIPEVMIPSRSST